VGVGSSCRREADPLAEIEGQRSDGEAPHRVMFSDGTSPDQVYTYLATHTRKEMGTEKTPGGCFGRWSFSFSGRMPGFPDARKIFLTDENGFLTYHGFLTITSSSRIISLENGGSRTVETLGLGYSRKFNSLFEFF
jgi:hypothetical protein